jgi:hypothetical protein
MARKLRARRTSILTGRVFVRVKAAGGICYRERMRSSRGDAEASLYIVQDHEEALREIAAISSTCNPVKGF